MTSNEDLRNPAVQDVCTNEKYSFWTGHTKVGKLKLTFEPILFTATQI